MPSSRRISFRLFDAFFSHRSTFVRLRSKITLPLRSSSAPPLKGVAIQLPFSTVATLPKNKFFDIYRSLSKRRLYADMCELRLFFGQKHDAFYMICMREHINGADFFDLIAFVSEHIQIPCERFGVAGDVDNSFRSGNCQ